MRKIDNLREYLHEFNDGDRIYNFLSGINEKTEIGKHCITSDIYVNVISYETNGEFDEIFEAHKNYIDVHVMIMGEEMLYYGLKEKMSIVKEYDQNEDCALLHGKIYQSVECKEGEAVEFLVEEPHMAGLCVRHSQRILKAVVKIPVTLLS